MRLAWTVEEATGAPLASNTENFSSKTWRPGRELYTSACPSTTADAAVWGPMLPSGPEVMAPVTAEGKKGDHGTRNRGSAELSQT